MASAEFLFEGIVVGGLTKQLTQPGHIKNAFRKSTISGMKAGSVLFYYIGVQNSSRIIRQKNDYLNHFCGGFIAGSLTSLTIGFADPSVSQGVTTIHVKADPSGVFKQVKTHSSRSSLRHLMYGLGCGTFFTAYHLYTNGVKNKTV